MIQQHYYTRDRRGIFSKTPGYDTVAKSENLDNKFIVEVLQDLCFYESPAELAGEVEVEKYPCSLFAVNSEDDRMIIGKSSFAGRDYTAQRNRYFTHNYIIPKEEKEIYIKNPEKIIYSKGFIYDYNISKGHIIPEVSEIQYEKCRSNSIEEMYNRACINKGIFVKLIKAAFHAAKYDKKIYIVLNCSSTDINDVAKEVLNYLYRAIPYSVRRKIGFITYMKNARNKKHINIVFLCKKSIKRLNTELKAGYVFDIYNKEFYTEGIDEKSYAYVNYVMDNIEKTYILSEFFNKIDKFDFEYELNLNKYDDIFKFNNINGCENKENNCEIHGNEKEICENNLKIQKIEDNKSKYIKIIIKAYNKIKDFIYKN